MELWIPITLAAAFLQNLRSAMQKHLQARLGTAGATFVRFGYGFPFALAYAGILHLVFSFDLPRPNATFIVYGTIGGIAQILATACLLASFAHRNFTVGTTFSKTETVQTAVIGIVILGDRLTAGATIGILVSLAGVIALSVARSDLRDGSFARALVGKAALLGLASGSLFGVSAVTYRAASLALEEPNFVMSAAFTLVWVGFLQTAIMLAYLRLRHPGAIGTIAAAWRPSLLVGLTAAATSTGWITALTLESAAYVRALGQVELVFTFIASTLVFRERSNRIEIAGILTVVAGILILLVGG